MAMIRIGQGIDVHQLVEGRKLIIGGVEIAHSKGLLGHSDADVLVHAIMDAILGAAGKGVIGQHFPDTDKQFKDISSLFLLKEVSDIISKFKVTNIDATIVAQEPKMQPHFTAMQDNIARCLGIDCAQVNIKATTTEWLGFTGRKEGIAAMAVVLLESKE